jgi:hypothetical protein
VGVLRVEFYSDCLYSTDFAADLGLGFNGTISNGVMVDKTLSIAGEGVAVVVNRPFRGSDRSVLVVRNARATLRLADITVPSDVGRYVCNHSCNVVMLVTDYGCWQDASGVECGEQWQGG